MACVVLSGYLECHHVKPTQKFGWRACTLRNEAKCEMPSEQPISISVHAVAF